MCIKKNFFLASKSSACFKKKYSASSIRLGSGQAPTMISNTAWEKLSLLLPAKKLPVCYVFYRVYILSSARNLVNSSSGSPTTFEKLP